MRAGAAPCAAHSGVMSHWASDGFDLPGGVDKEEYEAIFDKKGAVEGMIYRVISKPSDARPRRPSAPPPRA